MHHLDEPDYKRITLAIFLAAIMLLGWNMFVEWPRRQHMAQVARAQIQKQIENKQKLAETVATKEGESEYNPNLTREQRLSASKRVTIASDTLHGSIALTGARFDDLTLAKYKADLDPTSPEVTLLSPNGDESAYFAQNGWVSADGKTKVPDSHSVWKADKTRLQPGETLTLRWDNGEGVTFVQAISLDTAYMFSITQQVENHTNHAVSVTPYGYINRTHIETASQNMILHEGPMGVVEGTVAEIPYQDLRKEGNKTTDKANGWLGFTDKYWLTALIPDAADFKANFSHYKNKTTGQDRYQVDYLSNPQTIEAGQTANSQFRLFAGAKELDVLDRYTTGDSTHKPIPLFDRAVDFGSLYFLTKPLFLMLNFFYHLVGNFGLAIMMITVVVKICMFPMANKSYKSMAKMRILQPEMTKLRERYHDDPIALQKETLALYKRHSVNPASGCLPLIVQMPVFFALYKVLFVTIEMRHAPFFSWLKDLSAADHSNLFTAFGLIPWNTPSYLHLGALPILYSISMIIQQRQQPAPTDPMQAKMIKIMPFAFLLIFNTLPAGLLVYWIWSNVISILQQEIITLRHGHHRSQIRKRAQASTAS